MTNSNSTRENGPEERTEPPYNESELELIIQQYERAEEIRRHYQTQIWHAMSVITGVNGSIILVIFHYTPAVIAQLTLVFIGIVFTSVTLIAVIKHRYLAISASDTLRAIEDEFELKSVQVKSSPDEDRDYWRETNPGFIQKISSEETLIRGIGVILIAMIFIFIYILYSNL